jgi:hypothetical protein
MSSSYAELREAWSEANESLSLVEERLAAKWTAYYSGTGPQPHEQFAAEVAGLRVACAKHLATVLDTFNAATTSHHVAHKIKVRRYEG